MDHSTHGAVALSDEGRATMEKIFAAWGDGGEWLTFDQFHRLMVAIDPDVSEEDAHLTFDTFGEMPSGHAALGLKMFSIFLLLMSSFFGLCPCCFRTGAGRGLDHWFIR